MPEIAVIASFLDRYRAFVSGKKSDFLQGLDCDLKRIGSRLTQLSAEAREHVVQSAPEFNVYSVLQLGRRETIVHTPMLEHLLNPRASHAQGNLFLRQFFAVINQAGVVAPSESFDEFDWMPRKNKNTQFGNLDLVVRCQSLKYLMVIENKVDAGEEDQQLKRYDTWMKTQKQSFPKQELIFLTPRGSESKTAGDARYCRVSYCQHVRKWLNDCLPQIKAPAVREVIRQYLKTIESF